jgi:hypothetical protein
MAAEIEPPYLLIQEELKSGMVVPFLGAGASRSKSGEASSAALPSAGELSLLLAKTTSFPSEDPRDRGDLAKVASYFVEINGRKLLRRQLRGHLAVNATPGALHEYLASLPGNGLIITTNYDTLLEQALDAKKKPFHLVVHPIERDDWRGSVLWWSPGATEPQTPAANMLDIDLDKSTVIYKMHGTVGRSASGEWDNFVITEDDYTEFLSQMSGGNSVIPAIFQAHFRERNFLFLGYSLSDWNLRVILKNLSRHLQAEGRSADFAAWAIQRNPSLFERKLWGKRDVEIFDQDIDEFVARLREAGG